jgi:hypothetical protein
MKYLEFKNTFREFPLISLSHLYNAVKNTATFKVQLNQWLNKGLIIKLRKGLYILNENDRKIHPSRIFLANALYSPSYVSTEYALGYYDLIPEKVEDVTSVTTKNVKRFNNPLGTFIYQHLKTDLFFGFKEILDDNKFPVHIAEPEKAILDFIYLNLADFKNKDQDVFALSYRLQNLDLLKKNKLLAFAKRYNKVVLALANNLLNYIKEIG